MTKPRVILADDHRLFVAGLERLLAAECSVVGTAHDETSLLNGVTALNPDIVMLAMSLPPTCTGIDTIRELRELAPSVKIIVVTVREDPDAAAEAFRAGASAYVLKSGSLSELLAAVRCAMEGKTYVTPLVAGGMIHTLTTDPRERGAGYRITTRQREVLHLLAQGKSMKEAAAILNVATRTVAYHKYRMMQMLNIKSSAELVRFAIVKRIA